MALNLFAKKRKGTGAEALALADGASATHARALWEKEPSRVFYEEFKARVRRNLALNAKDGSVLVRVPAGEFEMGDGQGTYCPKHSVYVGEYWVGVCCVTNGQYGQFVRETGHREPLNVIWKEAGKRDHPVVNVSWDDAVAYGKWAGLELPTEAQWEKACRGPHGLIYPWGAEWGEGKNCRNDKNKGSELTARVSGYPSGVSGYGTYQQSGNVSEWCTDRYEHNYYKSSPGRDPKGPARGADRVIRGGSWGLDDASYFRGACRIGCFPTNRDAFQGFRLVRAVQ